VRVQIILSMSMYVNHEFLAWLKQPNNVAKSTIA